MHSRMKACIRFSYLDGNEMLSLKITGEQYNQLRKYSNGNLIVLGWFKLNGIIMDYRSDPEYLGWELDFESEEQMTKFVLSYL